MPLLLRPVLCLRGPTVGTPVTTTAWAPELASLEVLELTGPDSQP